MATDSVKQFDGKTFLWDGILYNNERDAREAMSSYEQNGFETRIIEEQNKYLVYSRRVVTQVVIEGQPI